MSSTPAPKPDRHAQMFALLRQGDEVKGDTIIQIKSVPQPSATAQKALRDYAINSFRRPN